MKKFVSRLAIVILCLLCAILCIGVLEISPVMLLVTAILIIFLMLCHTYSEKRKILRELKEAKTVLDEDSTKQREEWGQIAQKYSELEKRKAQIEHEEQLLTSGERTRDTLKRSYSELYEKYHKLYDQMQEGVKALENVQAEVAKLEEQAADLREEIESGEKARAELLAILSNLKLEHETLEIDNEKTIRLLKNYAEERSNQRSFIETTWRSKIDSGNLPENISLRRRNRRNFFVYVKLKESHSDGSCTYRSVPFGNAMDAKMFGDSLEGILKTQCKVREGERRGEYIVWIEKYPPEMMEEYYQKHVDAFEFANPAFDDSPENHEIISDEKRMLMAMPNPKGYKTGEDYEKYVAGRLASGGYMNISLTPTSNDYGADVICEKDGVKYCVQCKMYSNPVGVSAVQEIVTAKAHYQCERAMVITNNVFTAQAKKLASENAVILVDNFT